MKGSDCLNVNEVKYLNSSVNPIKIGNNSSDLGFVAGDVIEGIVTDMNNRETKISLGSGENSKEVSLPSSSVKNTYIGDKRQFQVIEASKDKLVLKDLGSVAVVGKASAGMSFTTVNSNLSTLVEDFSETMGDKEKEDNDSIERLSEKDYSKLKAEGFSIEDFKAERLAKAIERVKEGIKQTRARIDREKQELTEARTEVEYRVAMSVAKTGGMESIIAESLVRADLPVTEDRVKDIAGAIRMAAGAGMMKDSSYAYLINNELKPTAENVYKAAYGGVISKSSLSDEIWSDLESEARIVADSADSSLEDAKWLLEYRLPLTKENLDYKKELESIKSEYGSLAHIDEKASYETLRENPALFRTIEAAIDAIYSGHKAKEAVLSSVATIESARYKLTIESSNRVMDSLGVDNKELELLAREWGFTVETEVTSAVELTTSTLIAVNEIKTAPEGFLGVSFSERNTISISELAVKANAAKAYQASETEIRTDLGDSIKKAFGNIDDLLKANNMDITADNQKAVRILGYNQMEITEENINDIKFFAAKVEHIVDSLKPAVVMGLIRKGVNPLDRNLDSLKESIDQLMEEEGYSSEDKFSTFLLNLEQKGNISEEERSAYIGIYRLLYQVQKNDGAAIGALLKSKKELSLKNLLSEVRSSRASIDALIDDASNISHSTISNSISDQIREAFIYQNEVVDNILDYTEPELWLDSLEPEIPNEAYMELTPEVILEKLQAAERVTETINEDQSSLSAAEIRQIMLDGINGRRFLKSFGIKDSINYLRALDDEINLPLLADDELMPNDFEAFSKAYDGGLHRLKERAEIELDDVNDDARVINEINPADIKAIINKYNLLTDLSKNSHYEFVMQAANNTKVNLTLMEGKRQESSISIKVTAESFEIRADMRMRYKEGRFSVEGLIGCNSQEEVGRLQTKFEAFTASLAGMGMDTSSLVLTVDNISGETYLNRLGQQKRETERTAKESDDFMHVDNTTMYKVVKTFLEQLN